MLIVDNTKKKKKKGKLVTVNQGKGRGIKMYLEDAIEAGLHKPAQKIKLAEENKMLVPDETKQQEPEPEAQDDFTTIDGIGKASDRLLKSRGVNTFDQLREANLESFSTSIQNAVDRWKDD